MSISLTWLVIAFLFWSNAAGIADAEELGTKLLLAVEAVRKPLPGVEEPTPTWMGFNCD